jgi:methionine--tRNA ligase beta chain
MDKVAIDDFIKLEFKVGTVVEASDIEGSERLLKLTVDLGEESHRQILSGIKQWYRPEDLEGEQFVFITNLEPRKMMGLESQGMILAADGEKPVPLVPQEKVPNGSKIR